MRVEEIEQLAPGHTAGQGRRQGPRPGLCDSGAHADASPAVTGCPGAGRETGDSHVSPPPSPRVASWSDVSGGPRWPAGETPSGSRGRRVAGAERAVLGRPSLAPALTCLGVALGFPREQGHWPSVPGPGSPPACVRPGPQASSFSPLPARSRDPAAASVKDIPEVSGVSSNPGHGDQAPLHDLPGELSCAGGRGAARTTWGVSSPGAGRTASSDRSGTIEC